MSNDFLAARENVESLIYNVRGKQVMLDSDLAKLYGCKNGTKEINQAVRNNPLKFPERYSWVLTDEESAEFLVKNFDQKLETRGGRFKNPRVFTEYGVYMLSTILKTKLATEITLRIMDTFVLMKKYISTNLLEQKYYNDMIIRHDSEIKEIQKSFKELEDTKEANELFFDGRIYDAYSKIMDIFGGAKNELILIDRYVDKTILDMIKDLKCKVTLITSKTAKLSKLDIEKYNSTYNNLTIIYNDEFHDLYFVLDKDEIYHSGNSINHIGYRKSSIDLLEDEKVKRVIMESIERIIALYQN